MEYVLNVQGGDQRGADVVENGELQDALATPLEQLGMADRYAGLLGQQVEHMNITRRERAVAFNLVELEHPKGLVLLVENGRREAGVDVGGVRRREPVRDPYRRAAKNVGPLVLHHPTGDAFAGLET